MTTGVLCPVPILQFFDNQGRPAVSGSVRTTIGAADAATYQDVGLGTPLPNPIPLNSRGEVSTSAGASAQCFLTPNTVYTFTLSDANGNQLNVASYVNGAQLPDPPWFVQTPAEIAAGVVPVQYWYMPGDVRRYGATGNGVTDDTTAFQNAADSNSMCTVPVGTFLITNVTVANDDVGFYGTGWDTVLQVGAPNSNLFTVTGQNFQIHDCQWVGDLSSGSSADGFGVYLDDAGGAIFEDNFSTSFGFGAIGGIATTALAGPKIIRHRCRLTGVNGTEFYLGGIWVGTLIDTPDCSSATADRCLLLFDNSTTGWSGITVRGGGSQGYLKQQWAVTDEHWDGSSRVWNVLFDGITCRQSNWSAIKCKTSRGIRIVNCIFDLCGLDQEDQPSGLYGDVLCNSLSEVLVSNCQFRNSGSVAIRIVAPGVFQYPGSTPAGQATSVYTVSNNQIDTTGVVFSAQGDGIDVVNGFKDALVTGNVMRGIIAYGINATQTVSTPFWDLGVFNNTITDSPTMTEGLRIGFGQNLRMNGNLIQNGGATGVILTDIQSIQIGAQDTILDPAASGRGYQIGNVQDLDFRARAGNSTYDLWVALTPYAIGARIYNGANVYECVDAGTSGNAGGPVNTVGASTDGTVTWYFVGKYQLMTYAVRLVGTQGKVNLDFDPAGCITGPVENIICGAGGTRIHYTTSIATTGNTPTNAQIIPIPDLSAWMAEFMVLAQGVGVGRNMYQKAGLFYRAGGVTVQQGATQLIVELESAAAWDCDFLVTANSLAPARVTGAAATNINWAIDVTLIGMP